MEMSQKIFLCKSFDYQQLKQTKKLLFCMFGVTSPIKTHITHSTTYNCSFILTSNLSKPTDNYNHNTIKSIVFSACDKTLFIKIMFCLDF